MSRPPIQPEQTLSGIAIDPQTLERVIPESKRADGTVRKQIKIRPGFTPQEDVRRFRGTRQQQMDSNALPKGHIVGWVPPSQPAATSKPMTKSAKKNAKRKERREEKRAVPDSWEDEEEEETPPKIKPDGAGASKTTAAKEASPPPSLNADNTANAKTASDKAKAIDDLSSKFEKTGLR